MRTIKYKSLSTVRLEFPLTWDARSISSVDLTVETTDGYLESTIHCTLKTPVKLTAAALSDDLDIVLSGNVLAKDWLRLQDGYGAFEDVEVKSFEGVTKTATLKTVLMSDHAIGADAYGMFCTASVDTTNTTEFNSGKQLVLTWTPSSGFPVVERAVVSSTKIQIPNLSERLKNLHPREFDVLDDDGRLEEMLDESINQLSTELRLRNIFIDKVIDTELLIPVLLAKIRFLVLNNGAPSVAEERNVAKTEFLQQLELLCNSDVFQDVNSDGIIDPKLDHKQFFERGF
jgi:hypothetical protein